MNSGLLEHMKAFVAIAHSRNITAASIALNISQATLSRQLAALEKRVGCSLLDRSTRAMRLTQEGALYLRHAERMLALSEEADEAMLGSKSRLQGRLRVACSHAFARKVLIPLMGEWQQLNPHIHVELVISDGLSQLVEEQIDVAFRVAPLQPSNLVARAIGVSHRIVVASRAYLRSHRPIKSPADLREHQCIVFTGAEQPNRWQFVGPGGSEIVEVRGALSLSSVDALQDAVTSGLGVALTPVWFWTPQEREQRVQQLLHAYRLPAHTINAVTNARRASAGKTKRFVDYVAAALNSTEMRRTSP
jgi:DNA-binding transcriptional LysR family regulator